MTSGWMPTGHRIESSGLTVTLGVLAVGTGASAIIFALSDLYVTLALSQALALALIVLQWYWRKANRQISKSSIRIAVMKNDGTLLKRMIAAGVPVNDADGVGGDAPLHTAAKWNHSEMATILLDLKADPNIMNNFGLTPLHCATSSGSMDTARVLIEHGAPKDARALDGRVPFEYADDDGMRVLCGGASLEIFRALERRDLPCVQKLLNEKEIDASVRNARGDSALIMAVKAAIHKDTGAASASTRRRDRCVGYALVRALINNPKAKKGSLATALETTGRDGRMPLHLLAAAKDAELMADLLNVGAPVNAVARADSGGETALQLAIEGDDDDDNDDDDDDDGSKEEALVKLLLDHRADPNIADLTPHPRTPFHAAVRRGKHAAAALLLSARADMTHCVRKQNCLHVAVLNRDGHMVQALLSAMSQGEREALLDAKGRDGWTPLGFAARSGNVAIGKALIEAGASPRIAMPSGSTALEIALANRKPAMVELLRSASSK